MSIRYQHMLVCAMDSRGERSCIYTCYDHAGGGEYTELINVGDGAYKLRHYPMEDLTEETGEKLPRLEPEDLQSYFTQTPTEAMRQVLEKTQGVERTFVRLVMVVQHGVTHGVYEAESICVTGQGMERRTYDATAAEAEELLERILY